MKIDFYIKRSQRRKSITIKIEQYPPRVVVLAPKLMPQSRIESFVQQKSKWITEHFEIVQKRNILLPKLQTGEKIFVAGQYYMLDISQREDACIRNDVINLPIGKEKNYLYAYAKKLLLPYALKRTKEIADSFGLRFNSIKIGNAKTKWGSCDSKGRIIYSTPLAFLPPEIIEYVILHELCHTVEMNHGKKFYSLLARFMPDYVSRVKRLKEYSPLLHFFID